MMSFFIECPCCNQSIEILAVNCGIFRCGVMKETHNQIDPHLSKIDCEILVRDDKLYGCGKPFRLVKDEGTWSPVACDYI